MIINIPTGLTLLRIAMIPIMLLLHYYDYPLAASVIFGIAGLTDWADGYMARRLNQESRLGAFLDPVADKLIVIVALILIVEREASLWITLASIAIIGREVIISALREWMAETGQRSKVAAAYIGKIKTTVQIFALIFLLYNKPLWGLPIHEMGLVLLAIATVLTLVSMVQYLLAALKKS